jgi:hypothetical protein
MNTGSTPLSKSEFVKQANSTCESGRKDLFKELERYSEAHKGLPQSVLRTRTLQEVFVPMLEAENAAIRKLGAPAGDEQEVARIFSAVDEAIEEVKEDKPSSFIGFAKRFASSDKELEAYGLINCVKRG